MSDAKRISIYDTLSDTKKEIFCQDFYFKPFNMYVCGITPYDYAHIGHARCYVVYDVLIRLLRFFGITVFYVQNITDVNDKITKKAVDVFGDGGRYTEIAHYYFDHFYDCCQKLGCLTPDKYPRVSESMHDIIALIAMIMEKGFAYETDDGVYFSAHLYPRYGELSKRFIGYSLISRIGEKEHQKEQEYDFALWKKQPISPSWDSPWGRGVPGWHVECSAMIAQHFSDSLHLHGGGRDLIFPHHENEKAQSECCFSYDLSRIWMHIAFININQEKMSKSLGNSIYIKDIFDVVDPMVFRYYLLLHQYQSPIEFSYESLKASEQAYVGIVSFFSQEITSLTIVDEQESIIAAMEASLTDNLNTALFIGLFFKYQKAIVKNKNLFIIVKNYFQEVLGLSLVQKRVVAEHKDFDVDQLKYIKELHARREQARKAKNFILADEIKKELLSLGCLIQDKKIES